VPNPRTIFFAWVAAEEGYLSGGGGRYADLVLRNDDGDPIKAMPPSLLRFGERLQMKTVKRSSAAESMPAFDADHTIKAVDPELWRAIERENRRQHDHIELIASENYVSRAVMQAQGSQLTNKYAEGYPGRRYYGGCEFVDVVEQLAIDRVKDLFGAAYANVQPHSGSQANQAVYLAVLKPGDVILGMSLAHGGHLTHGAPVNVSGKLFRALGYGLHPDTEEIDYDSIQRLADEHKPKMIVAGASAYSRVIDWRRFREIADSIGAYLFVDMAHYAGLVAARLYPNPVGVADFVTSTTHKTLRGPRGGFILAAEQHAKVLNSIVFPALQGGPLMHVIAAKAVAFKEALDPKFTDYLRPTAKASGFPAPIPAKAGTMPAHDGLGADDRDDLEDRRKPTI